MKVNSIYGAGDNFVNDNLSNNKYMNRINSYYFILFENKDISASIILITTKDIVFCVTEAIQELIKPSFDNGIVFIFDQVIDYFCMHAQFAATYNEILNLCRFTRQAHFTCSMPAGKHFSTLFPNVVKVFKVLDIQLMGKKSISML